VTQPLTVTCAFDEGPGIGLGHRRRCEAIVGALRGIAGVTTATAPLRDAPFATDVLVVDSYKRRADDPDLVAHPIVVALDDLDRDLAVDCVVDPGLSADGTAHRRARRVLAGPRYALVDGALATTAHAPIGRTVRDVIVTMGAADADGIGARIAGRLVEWIASVRLVVGPWGARAVPDGVTPVEARAGLADELASADLVVTAGGVTLLEAFALGRPCVVVATATNQQANVAGAVAAGAACVATPSDAPETARRLASDAGARGAMAAAARALVDGGGAARVAAMIVELARTTTPIGVIA
jgi:spore coat polysaccharide biosynthesis predicted glycosyltransferase SpsG